MDEKAVCIIYIPAIILEEHFMETHNGVIIVYIYIYVYKDICFINVVPIFIYNSMRGKSKCFSQNQMLFI